MFVSGWRNQLPSLSQALCANPARLKSDQDQFVAISRHVEFNLVYLREVSNSKSGGHNDLAMVLSGVSRKQLQPSNCPTQYVPEVKWRYKSQLSSLLHNDIIGKVVTLLLKMLLCLRKAEGRFVGWNISLSKCRIIKTMNYKIVENLKLQNLKTSKI